MSGDVTAAFERLRRFTRSVPPEHLESLDAAITVVLAEVERLRSEVENLHGSVDSAHEHEEILAVDNARLTEENERLRAERDEAVESVVKAYGRFEDFEALVFAEKDIARALRAEREARQSMPFAIELVDTVMSCMGTDYTDLSPTFRASLETQMAHYVLNVLNGRDPEADQ